MFHDTVMAYFIYKIKNSCINEDSIVNSSFLEWNVAIVK